MRRVETELRHYPGAPATGQVPVDAPSVVFGLFNAYASSSYDRAGIYLARLGDWAPEAQMDPCKTHTDFLVDHLWFAHERLFFRGRMWNVESSPPRGILPWNEMATWSLGHGQREATGAAVQQFLGELGRALARLAEVRR